jgi:hypothetical protein
MVITGVFGVTVPVLAALGAAAVALAALGGAGGEAGFAACPHDIAVKNNTQINPR